MSWQGTFGMLVAHVHECLLAEHMFLLCRCCWHTVCASRCRRRWWRPWGRPLAAAALEASGRCGRECARCCMCAAIVLL